MSAIPNPIYAGTYPGTIPPTNVTGTNISVPGSSPSSSGANPLLPSTGTSTSAPTSTNPFTAGFPSGTVPTFGANTGGAPAPSSGTGLFSAVPGAPTTNAAAAAASPIGGANLMSSSDIATLYQSLTKTYGAGTAHALLDFLTTGAGFNQQAINNLFAAMQPQIERGTESLENQFSATGNRFGSGAQIGTADYLSQVNLNEGQLETQMYEQSVSNYINTLMGTAGGEQSRIANSPSTMDTISQDLGLAGTVANAANSTGASGSGTLSQILTMIAGMGGA
jgi:hypothetical protein